ncbi:SHOCT domain-containing protein [Saccharopolyspora sp. HNM0986]|nr:SHOCT domain-containing protein [Saccharopolyspora sp. HNM0986]
MMGDMYPAMGLWMALWGLISLAILILIVVAIVWLVRAMTRPNTRATERQDHAEEVLRRRYAAGEIDEEEYERRRSTLRGQ